MNIVWVEVKGYIDADGLEKWKRFNEMMKNKDCKMLLIEGMMYKKLTESYKHLEHWE